MCMRKKRKNVFEDRSDEILEHSTTARLLSFPNVMITSHQGFFTEEALAAISQTTLDNAMAFLHWGNHRERSTQISCTWV